MPSCSCRPREPHDVLGVRQPERHEQQAGLVDVPIVVVDHGDRGLVLGVQAAQAVCRQRATRATAEDHNARIHSSNVPVRVLAR